MSFGFPDITSPVRQNQNALSVQQAFGTNQTSASGALFTSPPDTSSGGGGWASFENETGGGVVLGLQGGDSATLESPWGDNSFAFPPSTNMPSPNSTEAFSSFDVDFDFLSSSSQSPVSPEPSAGTNNALDIFSAASAWGEPETKNAIPPPSIPPKTKQNLSTAQEGMYSILTESEGDADPDPATEALYSVVCKARTKKTQSILDTFAEALNENDSLYTVITTVPNTDPVPAVPVDVNWGTTPSQNPPVMMQQPLLPTGPSPGFQSSNTPSQMPSVMLQQPLLPTGPSPGFQSSTTPSQNPPVMLQQPLLPAVSSPGFQSNASEPKGPPNISTAAEKAKPKADLSTLAWPGFELKSSASPLTPPNQQTSMNWGSRAAQTSPFIPSPPATANQAFNSGNFVSAHTSVVQSKPGPVLSPSVHITPSPYQGSTPYGGAFSGGGYGPSASVGGKPEGGSFGGDWSEILTGPAAGGLGGGTSAAAGPTSGPFFNQPWGGQFQ